MFEAINVRRSQKIKNFLNLFALSQVISYGYTKKMIPGKYTKQKKTKFLVVKNSKEAEKEGNKEGKEGVIVSRKWSDSVMYLIKASHADTSVYEFSTKGHNMDDIVSLVHNIKCRRNAFCEQICTTIVDALEEYLCEKVIGGEW